MHIQIAQNDLIKAMNIASKANSQKTNIKLHTLLFFKAKNNMLSIYATDGVVTIDTYCPCKVVDEGEFSIDQMMMSNIIRKMPNEIITIKDNNNTIDINCKNIQFNIKTFDMYQREEVVKSGSDYFYLDSFLFKDCLKKSEFVVDQLSAKVEITGIRIKFNEGKISFTGLDGYRIAMRTIEADYPKNFENKQYILPKKSAGDLMYVLNDLSEVKISVNQKTMIFENEKTIVYSSLIDRKYLEFDPILQTPLNIRVRVKRRDILRSLERVSILSDHNRANLITMIIEDDFMRIESENEKGNAGDFVNFIEHEGANLTIGFNVNFLLDAIKSFEDEELDLYFMDPGVQVLIKKTELNPEDDYLHLVLPIKLMGQ